MGVSDVAPLLLGCIFVNVNASKMGGGDLRISAAPQFENRSC